MDLLVKSDVRSHFWHQLGQCAAGQVEATITPTSIPGLVDVTLLNGAVLYDVTMGQVHALAATWPEVAAWLRNRPTGTTGPHPGPITPAALRSRDVSAPAF